MGVFIIAEAGVNHNGSFEIACKLADVAKDVGADAIKFQTFKAESLVTQDASTAEYQQEAVGRGKSQLDMLKELELTNDEFIRLKQHCDEIGILFCTTTFDMDSTEFALRELDLPFMKVPSGEITNLPLLEAIGRSGKPVILSTGMCEIGEVEDAVHALRSAGSQSIAVLHCTSQYPAPFEDVNLRAMVKMGEDLELDYGYSDHTLGTSVAAAAVALGASIVEKHFTLDRTMEGPDHKASLDPDGLKELVKSIRCVQSALGSAEKHVSNSERANRDIVRKSIVAIKPIRAGEVFSENNIGTKRPGTGLSPMKWHAVLGQIASRDFESDEEIAL